MNPLVGAQIGIGALEAGIGIADRIGSKKRTNALLDKIKPFQTQQEIYDILNATSNQSQGDTITRDFQKNQLDQTTANVLGTATKLGADPNSLSKLFEMSVAGSMKIGNDFHQSNMQGFQNLMNAMKLLSDNKDAEFFSEQNIIKDRLAAENSRSQSATANISGGINTITGAVASQMTADLYKKKEDLGVFG